MKSFCIRIIFSLSKQLKTTFFVEIKHLHRCLPQFVRTITIINNNQQQLSCWTTLATSIFPKCSEKYKYMVIQITQNGCTNFGKLPENIRNSASFLWNCSYIPLDWKRTPLTISIDKFFIETGIYSHLYPKRILKNKMTMTVTH